MQRAILGLVLLGFTSVYREGFEVVLFLQNLRLRYGSGVVLEGVVVGLLLVAAIGWLTFGLQSKLPYKQMLVATGVMLGVVLLVMVGESVQELQQAGWIGTTPINVAIPGWMGLWFAVFPNVQTIVAQAVAAVLVVGSYFLAEELRVRRPRRRGAEVARSAESAEVAERPSAPAGACAAAGRGSPRSSAGRRLGDPGRTSTTAIEGRSERNWPALQGVLVDNRCQATLIYQDPRGDRQRDSRCSSQARR